MKDRAKRAPAFPGKALKIKKTAVRNNYTISGPWAVLTRWLKYPRFAGYLRTLLYGYALRSAKEEQGAQRFSLSAVLQYYDISEE